jgi:hypothetical protein
MPLLKGRPPVQSKLMGGIKRSWVEWTETSRGELVISSDDHQRLLEEEPGGQLTDRSLEPHEGEVDLVPEQHLIE